MAAQEHGHPQMEPRVQPFASPRGAVEGLLAHVHPLLMLPFGSEDPREAWIHEKRTFSFSGATCRTVLPRQADCLFFVEVANPPGVRR